MSVLGEVCRKASKGSAIGCPKMHRNRRLNLKSLYLQANASVLLKICRHRGWVGRGTRDGGTVAQVLGAAGPGPGSFSSCGRFV